MCKVYVIVINLEVGGNAAVWSSIFVDLRLCKVLDYEEVTYSFDE